MAELQLPNEDMLADLFESKEDKLMETGAWSEAISSSGGSLDMVQLDVKEDDEVENGWIFLARLTVESEMVLNDSSKQQIIDDLETIADDLDEQFTNIGLDPQGLTDYEVEIVVE